MRTATKRVRVACSAAAVATVATLVPTVAAAAPEPAAITAGTYVLTNACHGKALDVAGVSNADGADVITWSRHGGGNQQWQVAPTDDGYYRLTAVHSGRVLDVAGGGTADGTNVQQWRWLGGEPQQWRFHADADGRYVLRPRVAPGSALDVAGAEAADGTDVHLWTVNDSCAQSWQLHPVGGGTPAPTSPPPSTPPGTPAPSTPPSSGSGELALPASTWAESIGVGTRFDWKVDDGALPANAEALRRLGVKHVRAGLGCECDRVSQEEYVRQMNAMAAELGLAYAVTIEGESPDGARQKIDQWNAGGRLYALEGANETFERRDWWDGAFANSLELQRFIKSEADARGLQSYTWSQGGPIRPYTEWPNGAPYATHANFHMYPWDTSFEGGYFQRKILPIWQDGSIPEGSVATVRKWADDPDKKLAVTEWGYSYGDDPVGPIRDETARAKYIARNAFELINAGIDKSYYYSLVDEDNRFGLAERDGTLRPSGQVLANIFALLKDGGGGASGRLDYSMSTASGMPVVDDRKFETDEVHHTTLRSSDGSYWLALWVDSDSHDGEIGREQVTIDLKTPVRSVTPYTPLESREPGETLTGQRVTVTVPDHPLLLKITPSGS